MSSQSHKPSKSAPLNHRSIDIPMVPPCSKCGRTRIHWNRKTSTYTCLWEECKHTFLFFPSNEPSIVEMRESIEHMAVLKKYYSDLKGEGYFQSEKKRLLDLVSNLLSQLEDLGSKRDNADREIEWCDKQVVSNNAKISEISTRIRATTELTWKDASPSRNRLSDGTAVRQHSSSSSPKPRSAKLARSVWDVLRTANMTEEEIYKSMGLEYGKGSLVLTD